MFIAEFRSSLNYPMHFQHLALTAVAVGTRCRTPGSGSGACWSSPDGGPTRSIGRLVGFLGRGDRPVANGAARFC